MRRRAFLASAMTAASSITAGCSFIESRTEHTDPTVEIDDDQNMKYLVFREDRGDLATLGVAPPESPAPSEFGTTISHGWDTELQSLTQRFAVPDSERPPPRIALQGPFMDDHGSHPSVSVFWDSKAAVVKVHRFGGLADETVHIKLLVTRWPESARRLVVESTLELVEPGLTDQTHVLDGRLEFEVTTKTEAEEPPDDMPNSSA